MQYYVATCSLCSFLDSVATKFPWSQQYSFLQHIHFVATEFLCRDISFFGSLTICLARSVVLSVLCRDNLMCGYWNSYVATSTIVSRQCFYAASSNWCRDQVFMSRQHVCLVLVVTMFLVLSAFLLRLGKSVATESCRHLT